MSLDVRTGVVYGFYINLSKESVLTFEEVGFAVYPITYRADEVDKNNHEYVVGVPMMKLSHVDQSSKCSLTIEQLHSQFVEIVDKLSDIFTDFKYDNPAILVTSYYY